MITGGDEEATKVAMMYLSVFPLYRWAKTQLKIHLPKFLYFRNVRAGI